MSTTPDTATDTATTPAAPADQTTHAQATAQATQQAPRRKRQARQPSDYGPTRRRRMESSKLIAQGRNVAVFGNATPPDIQPDNMPPDIFEGDNLKNLLLIPDKSRARCILFLSELVKCRRYHQAQVAASVEFWEVEQAKRVSSAYKMAFDAINEQLLADRVKDIESAIAADAAGEDPEPGRRRPDNRNAALFLAANDPRYKPQATGGGATVVFDVHF